MRHTIAVHPGRVLLDELLERSIAQSTLARHIGVPAKTINEICRAKRGITADMAVRLASALGASAQFWMNLQTNWELSQVRRRPIRPLGTAAA
jgi:addiction module HigA family antidote